MRCRHPGRPGPGRRGRRVVLASGGFEWNEALVAAFVGQRLYPLSPPGNDGAALSMAMEAGAQLAPT